MATTSTRPMTFEEFEKLPDDRPGHRYELRRGEPVFLPPPIHEHHLIQRRLTRLLETAAGKAGEVSMELGFRPKSDHEYRIADVAVVEKRRWDSIARKGFLIGSPEVAIEVLSPSNTAAEMRDKRKLCLETGSREFWIVDLDLREVEVYTPDGQMITYKSGQDIPLLFGGRVAVDEIFS